MMLQMPARVPLFRSLPNITGPPFRNSVKFMHVVASGTPPATSPLRGHITTALQTGKFSTTTAAALWKSGEWSRSSTFSPGSATGWRCRVAFGAALAVGTLVLVKFLRTGAINAMARKVDLNSAEGDWKEIKDLLLSLPVKDRRQYYRTSGFVTLQDIPAWTPSAGDPGPSRYPRNEKLDGKISVFSGDITKLEIDAIVNAANKTLLGGGGVDGAIHRTAGPLLKKECASLHGCETGEAKISGGYGLPAKFVIHTVGPIAQGGVGEAERRALRSCYKNSLEAATENSARSVAFPCISTGIYGYPPEQAVHEALATVREFLDVHHDKLDRVILCVFLPTDKELYLQNLPLYFPAAPAEAAVKSKL